MVFELIIKPIVFEDADEAIIIMKRN